MKSNRSAKKYSKNQVNKSFKATKLDASFLLEEPIVKKSKKQANREPISSHRSNVSNKQNKLGGPQSTKGRHAVVSKRDSILHEREYQQRKGDQSLNNSNYLIGSRNNGRVRSSSKGDRKQRSLSKKRRKASSSKDVSEKRIEGFFEREYKEMQNEVLQSKSTIYEYKYKIDSLKSKLQKSEMEVQQIRLKYQKEKERSEEYFQRGEKYKEKCLELEEEGKNFEKELDDLVTSKNQEFEQLKNELEQVYSEMKQKDDLTLSVIKDFPFFISQLKVLLSNDIPKNARVKQILAEMLLIGDKFREIYGFSIEEASINQNSNGENINNSYFQSLENQSIGVVSDRNNESSLQKGEYEIAQRRQPLTQIQGNQQVLEEIRLKVQAIENENKILKDERENFMRQISKLENSNRNQEKMIHYLNSQFGVNRSSSFQSNMHSGNQFQSNEMLKNTEQILQQYQLQESDKQYSNNSTHGKLNTVQQQEIVPNLPQQQQQNQQVNENSFYSLQNDSRIYKNQQPYPIDNQKFTPLILKDPYEMGAGNSAQARPQGTINSTLQSVANKNYPRTNMMSPESTLSMQHIQFPNYRSPNSQHHHLNLNQNAMVIQQNWPVQQSQLSNITEVKNSGRSQQTSTFQQQPELLESLKEVKEEDEGESHSYSQAQQQQQIISSRSNPQLEEQYMGHGRYNDQYPGPTSIEVDGEDEAIFEHRIRQSNNASPQITKHTNNTGMDTQNKENDSMYNSKEEYDTLNDSNRKHESPKPYQSNKQRQFQVLNFKNKETITTSSQILSDRTLNLKKEINSLDEEIMHLQTSLQNALQKRNVNNFQK